MKKPPANNSPLTEEQIYASAITLTLPDIYTTLFDSPPYRLLGAYHKD